eukprot:scaffold6796_cov142-Skeletonema_menzelii.AAC.1
MAEAQGDDDEIFVYMGGDQQVPWGARRARIHRSVKIVPREAFYYREQLISVEFHDDIEIIEEEAFECCISLRSIKLLGVKIIKKWAFCGTGVTDVEFGDKLETIEEFAFHGCIGLKNIRMTSVRTIGKGAFKCCHELSDVEFGEELETLQEGAFLHCPKLKRIALPLKDNMIEDRVFGECLMLTTVDMVGGIHNTVASLHMESWRNNMNEEINRINETLPTITGDKTPAIQQWMGSAFHRLDHYKAEHQKLLKEATTLLELALWKANLDDNEG